MLCVMQSAMEGLHNSLSFRAIFMAEVEGQGHELAEKPSYAEPQA